MSRRVFLLGLGLALVALGLAFTDWALTPPQAPGITEANARRLRPGMTLEQARVILGKPGNCITGRIGLSIRRPETWLWISAEGAVMINCDATGRIERVIWAQEPQPSPLDRLRTWLG